MRAFNNYNLIIITTLCILFTENQMQAACFVQPHPHHPIKLSPDTNTFFFPDTLLSDTVQKQILPGKKEIKSDSFPAFNYNNVKNYIFSNLQYPTEALEKEIEGEVSVYFRIEKSGKTDSIRIVKPVHPSLDSAALKLIRNMPQWKPVFRQGFPESISYTVPVLFELK